MTGKDTTPTDNVIYDGQLYVGDYWLEETWVDADKYIGLSGKVTLSLTGDGTLSSDNVDAVVSGDSNSGFVVTVTNYAIKTVTLTKVLSDPLISSRRFTFSAEYELNGNTYPLPEIELRPTRTASGTIRVPNNAKLTVKENDTNDAYAIYNTTASGASSYDSNTRTAVINSVSGGEILTFTNTRKEVPVNVEKTVVGLGGTFHFTATVKNGSTLLSSYNSNNFVNGVRSFTLSPSNNGTASTSFNIPYGAVITVEETAQENYRTTVNGDPTRTYTSPALTAATTTVTFINTEIHIAPTGIDFKNTTKPFFYVLLLGSALAALAATNRRRRRRDGYDDEDTGRKILIKPPNPRTDQTGPPGGHDPPEEALLSGPRARGDETLLPGAPPDPTVRRSQIRPCRGPEAKASGNGMIFTQCRMRLLTETILARARGDPATPRARPRSRGDPPTSPAREGPPVILSATQRMSAHRRHASEQPPEGRLLASRSRRILRFFVTAFLRMTGELATGPGPAWHPAIKRASKSSIWLRRAYAELLWEGG